MENFSSKSQPSLNKRAGTKDPLSFVPESLLIHQ